MYRSRSTTRQFATCLLLSVVLILGIVQWSFLPVLIQDASFSGRTALAESPGHSAKFAAPFKCLIGDFDYAQPCLKQSSLVLPRPLVSFFRQPGELSFRPDDQFFPYCQLRAPPSA
jgi:hypothetical protein